MKCITREQTLPRVYNISKNEAIFNLTFATSSFIRNLSNYVIIDLTY